MDDNASPNTAHVLDQLSEHFKQINDILALVESEHYRETNTAPPGDSLISLPIPDCDDPQSPINLQSSLTSPLNSHVIEDLIRDSIQNDLEPIIIATEPQSNGDAYMDSNDYYLYNANGSPDDREWRTRKTLQTLAQLAELVDKGVSVHNISPDDIQTAESGENIPNNNKRPKGLLASFKPSRPVIIISKVRDPKKRKLPQTSSQPKKSHKVSKTTQDNTSNQTAQNTQLDFSNPLNLNFLLQGANGVQSNLTFIQCSDGTILPVFFTGSLQQERNKNENSDILPRPIIVIPPSELTRKPTFDSGTSVLQTDLDKPQTPECKNIPVPVVVIPPIVTINSQGVGTPLVVVPETSQLANEHSLPSCASNSSDNVTISTGDINAISQEGNDPGSPLLDALEDSSDASDCVLLKPDELKEVKCDYCSATFTRLCNYEKHLLVHKVFFSEEDIYKCSICDKEFLQNCDLKRHLQVHSGTEPYRCDVCDKAYIRKSDLTVHMRFHNKEKPFVCQLCNRGFSQNGDMRRHIRLVHEKTEKINCGHCRKKFTKEATLMQHMKKVHKDVILKSLAQQQIQHTQ